MTTQPTTSAYERAGGICIEAHRRMTQEGPSPVAATPHSGAPVETSPVGGWAPGYHPETKPHMCKRCRCLFIPEEPTEVKS